MRFIIMLSLLALVGFAMFSPQKSKAASSATYDVLERDGVVEFRHYPRQVVAETTVYGERKSAVRQGFQRLFNYIQGENSKNQKIAMTVPVMQRYKGEMENNGQVWNVQFFLPASAVGDTIPVPSDQNVSIVELEPATYATIGFSGNFDDQNLQDKKVKLQHYLTGKQINIIGNEIFAAYNAPWTPPLLRRNEVLFKIEQPTTLSQSQI